LLTQFKSLCFDNNKRIRFELRSAGACIIVLSDNLGFRHSCFKREKIKIKTVASSSPQEYKESAISNERLIAQQQQQQTRLTKLDYENIRHDYENIDRKDETTLYDSLSHQNNVVLNHIPLSQESDQFANYNHLLRT